MQWISDRIYLPRTTLFGRKRQDERTLDAQGRVTPFWPEQMAKRSQDLEPAWALNGAFYLIAPARLRQERRFLTPDTRPLMMDDPREAIDIDSPEDWALAEASLSREIR